ncbi:unnamed protein product [Owenia fusiformis]|uniref:Uncharacterized protein n=1 Tax=Owenia fusiformis TaxID=6347 RepID=A0A8J1XZW4_OWEFU|nr:unnamed protein product [Owenia fusiformis]
MSESGEKSPRKSPRRSSNKIYRTPRTPPPENLLEKERGFTLDQNAVSSISVDYSKANPKLGPVVPPFNSQNDKHTKPYFNYSGVDTTLKKTGQAGETGCSIEGKTMDKFHEAGAGHEYLSLRNQFGAGHSRELVDGHAQFMQGIKPITGYNGNFGYRRNTPWLRQQPSPFGTGSKSATH